MQVNSSTKHICICPYKAINFHRPDIRSNKKVIRSCKYGNESSRAKISRKKAIISHQLSSISSISSGYKLKIKNPLDNTLIAVRYKNKRNSIIVTATLVSSEESGTFLNQSISQNPDLVIGELDNGMRYVIFPNKSPPNRFEAHLEVHAGSVDEREDQQGLAHLVEHVTFLGSQKREGLLGTGARSNAYTDFHHTVFHVHAPLTNSNTGNPMLPQVLEALKDIAFQPQFLFSRIEKERRAVLSEALMMNTIEYRVDCQLLKYLHEENALSDRFPIGKTDQIKKWNQEMLKEYWGKWYYPANTTLYIVGELPGGYQTTEKSIKEVFNNVKVNMIDEDDSNNDIMNKRKNRQKKRPPVNHNMGCGPVDQTNKTPVVIYKHPLIHHFMLSVFCKLPVRSIKTCEDLKFMLMMRTVLSVLQFRINARYSEQNPPFMGIELDVSDSGREGCCVSTLTVTADPGDWKGAILVAIQEVRRMQRHGVKPGEMQRYLNALLKDSEQSAELSDSVPSIETLEYLMEALSLNHIIMDQRKMHELMVDIAQYVTLEEVNAISRSLLSFVSDFGKEEELIKESEKTVNGEWSYYGPTRATSVVACVPTFMDVTGENTKSGMPMSRGASLMTVDHVEIENGVDVTTTLPDEEEFEIPSGAIKFEITEDEIRESLMNYDIEVEAGKDVDVPDDLISDEEIQNLINERKPHYVPMENNEITAKDENSGVVRRRLSNGIRVNIVHTDNEPKSALMRMVVPGGRFSDKIGIGPNGTGSATVGTRALSESGTVSHWDREQAELFCVSRLINCQIEATEEFIVMDFSFPVSDGGLKAVLQLLHLFLEKPRWEESALQRSKLIHISAYKTNEKSLEGASLRRLATAMLGSDHRFIDPNIEEIEAIRLEEVKGYITSMLSTNDMEINFVGDLDAYDMEDTVLKYLGTVKKGNPHPLKDEQKLVLNKPETHIRHQIWHLQDSDERACGYIAGEVPSRWGTFSNKNDSIDTKAFAQIVPPVPDPEGPTLNPLAKSFATAVRRAHPLYPSTTIAILVEIINSRLFTTVRDELGLTYDVSMEVAQFDRQKGGWFSLHVTASPQKIHEAISASIKVLRDVAQHTINQRELARAKRTLITRHESELRTNAYWMGLITHLQSDQVPLKTVDCLRDIKAMYMHVSIQDLYDAYGRLKLDDDHIYTCIGTSGRVASTSPVSPLPPMTPVDNNSTNDINDINDDINLSSNIATTDQGENPKALWTAMISAAKAAMTNEDSDNEDENNVTNKS